MRCSLIVPARYLGIYMCVYTGGGGSDRRSWPKAPNLRPHGLLPWEASQGVVHIHIHMGSAPLSWSVTGCLPACLPRALTVCRQVEALTCKAAGMASLKQRMRCSMLHLHRSPSHCRGAAAEAEAAAAGVQTQRQRAHPQGPPAAATAMTTTAPQAGRWQPRLPRPSNKAAAQQQQQQQQLRAGRRPGHGQPPMEAAQPLPCTAAGASWWMHRLQVRQHSCSAVAKEPSAAAAAAGRAALQARPTAAWAMLSLQHSTPLLRTSLLQQSARWHAAPLHRWAELPCPFKATPGPALLPLQ